MMTLKLLQTSLEKKNIMFGSEDDESEFEGFQESFSPTKNTNGNNIGNNVNNNDEQSAVSKKNPDADAPAGFKIAKWKKGDSENMAEFPFTGKPGFNVEIPDDGDVNKLFFLTLFLSEEILDSLTLETNMYAFDFLTANKGKSFKVFKMARTYNQFRKKKYENF